MQAFQATKPTPRLHITSALLYAGWSLRSVVFCYSSVKNKIQKIGVRLFQSRLD